MTPTPRSSAWVWLVVLAILATPAAAEGAHQPGVRSPAASTHDSAGQSASQAAPEATVAPTRHLPAVAPTRRLPDVAPSRGPFSVVEHRGDVVTLSLSVGNTSGTTVTVTVTGVNDSGYAADVTVLDRDGDGRVTLRVNTYLAGHGGAYAAAGDDLVVGADETVLAGRLPTGRYSVRVRANGSTVDEAGFRLVPVTDLSVTALATLPGRDADLSTVASIRNAAEAGELRAVDRVGMRERVVVKLRAPGLSGALAAASGSNASTRFANLVTAPGFRFLLTEAQATVGLEQRPIRWNLTGSGIRLLPDARNDTYYLVFDVDEAPKWTEYDEQVQLEAGDAFDVFFALDPASGLVDHRRTAVAEKAFSVVEWSVTLDGGSPLFVRPAPNQTVRAFTVLPAGSRVVVTLHSSDGTVVREQVVTVRLDPHEEVVEATFDLSGLAPGTELRVRFRVDGRLLRERPARVRVVRHVYGVDVTESRRSPPAVTVNVTVDDDSFVVVHANSADGPVVGRSDQLEHGFHSVTIEVSPDGETARLVAVVHHDRWGDHRFGDQDRPVTRNGTPVADVVAWPPERTPTPTPLPTPTRSPASTPRSTDSTATGTTGPATTSTDADDTTGTSAGFGVGAALLATLSLCLALRKRR